MKRSAAFFVMILSVFVAYPLWASGFESENKSDRVDFDGEFSDINFSSSECEEIYLPREFTTKHFLVGPTNRTIVTYFENSQGEGIFHGLRFMSNFGYNNDFIYNMTVDRGNLSYKFHIEGFVDRNVVFMELITKLLDIDRDEICRSTATYSGFN